MAVRSQTESPEPRGERRRMLPAGAGRWFRRRFQELAALGLAAFAGALLVVSVTYNALDPSLNRATDGPVQNALGLYGAYVADVFMQTLGIAAWLLPLLLFAWVLRLLLHRGIPQFWFRLAALPAGLFLVTLAAQALPAPASWQVASGLGGVTGFLLQEQLLRLTGLNAGLLALVALLLALPTLAFASAIPFAAWRGLGHGLGRLVTGARARRAPSLDVPAEPDLREATRAPLLATDEEEALEERREPSRPRPTTSGWSRCWSWIAAPRSTMTRRERRHRRPSRAGASASRRRRPSSASSTCAAAATTPRRRWSC
jgi:S-DNA-T family DNA segregation ATPase FtsK/SpoIIIE